MTVSLKPRMHQKLGWAVVGLVACALLATPLTRAQTAPVLVMASTTSTEQSGLFAHLLPAFTQATGVQVKVVALGTGQAIDMGRRGDADVLFVHDQVAEEKVVAEGFAFKRYPVMYNDFVLVGPAADPAKVRGKDIVAALGKVSASNADFISRGDKSGTHAAELRFWKLIATPDSKGSGYKECGCGMGPALNIAAATGAFAGSAAMGVAGDDRGVTTAWILMSGDWVNESEPLRLVAPSAGERIPEEAGLSVPRAPT